MAKPNGPSREPPPGWRKDTTVHFIKPHGFRPVGSTKPPPRHLRVVGAAREPVPAK